MFRVVVNATNVINVSVYRRCTREWTQPGPAGNAEACERQGHRPRYAARRAVSALALSSCGSGFTRQPMGGVSRAAELRKLSCLPGGVLASNGSDMAVYKAH